MGGERTQEWIAVIEVEHAQLRGLLEGLEARLAASGSNPGEWGLGLCESLDALVPLLERHFEREEAALLPAAAAPVFPKLAQSLAALNGHHPRLLAAFRDLAGLAGAPGLDVERVAEVTRRARAAIEALREHERAETELFDTIELPD